MTLNYKPLTTRVEMYCCRPFNVVFSFNLLTYLNLSPLYIDQSLLIERKGWTLTAYCPKLRLCLMRRKKRTAEMAVWARVKRRRDDFTPLLSICQRAHTHTLFCFGHSDTHTTADPFHQQL